MDTITSDTSILMSEDVENAIMHATCGHDGNAALLCSPCMEAAVFHRKVYRWSIRQGIAHEDALATADARTEMAYTVMPLMGAVPVGVA